MAFSWQDPNSSDSAHSGIVIICPISKDGIIHFIANSIARTVFKTSQAKQHIISYWRKQSLGSIMLDKHITEINDQYELWKIMTS